MHHQTLISHITASQKLSCEDIELINETFEFEKYSKNTFLERENNFAKKLYFILDGFIRVFHENNQVEVTTQICSKNQLITAFESFVRSDRSKENVKTITDCEVLSITKENYNRIYNNSEGWRNFCRATYESIIKNQQSRTVKLLSMNAQERYIDLMEHSPELVQFVPVRFLSSYLGIKPESLSRIRKKRIS